MISFNQFTYSQDGTARLWEVPSGNLLHTLKHPNPVGGALFSPDGQTLITNDYEAVYLWDTASGHLLHRLWGHADQIWPIAISPDGKTILTGSIDKTARLWDAQTGLLLHILSGHQQLVYDVAFSPDSKVALTSSGDGIVRVWEVATGDLLHMFPRQIEGANRVVYSPDGQTLAIGTSMNTQGIATLWDPHTYGLIRPLCPRILSGQWLQVGWALTLFNLAVAAFSIRKRNPHSKTNWATQKLLA
jgi:WD40 repeat protein